MAKTSSNAVPARVTFLDGRGDLPMVEVSTAWSTAEIYLHGAHVTNFKKQAEPPLLFLSQCSRFEEKQPIRGGIPVIFPWFGPREGMATHGFARLHPWELKEVLPAADGSVSVRFRLPDCPEASTYPPFVAEYVVTVNEGLTLELIVTNKSTDAKLEFEECLHTYFAVDDITAASIAGLKGVSYLDKVANFAKKTETEESIRISSEVDRVYLDASGTVEIRDARLGRVIRIEKENSASTVVWNPWIAKAQQMPDFGNEEYQKMVCVESGNVNANKMVLEPGKSSRLKVKLSSGPV
jgi:D-hexose-6-phosphate mutarotase